MTKKQVRKYFVKSSWIFNLESMNDFCWCVLYDAEDGKIKFPVEIAGTVCKDEDDVMNLKDECNDLEWIAKSRKVTSKEYGRIKEIAEYRVMQRYIRCIESGMDDARAGVCFEEV